jgi:hypothetical protein
MARRSVVVDEVDLDVVQGEEDSAGCGGGGSGHATGIDGGSAPSGDPGIESDEEPTPAPQFARNVWELDDDDDGAFEAPDDDGDRAEHQGE